jgi:molybdopterin molybdotransferase
MWFGLSATGKPIFALPGNPVSTLVCTSRYVIPSLLEAMGLRVRPRLRVPLAETIEFEPDLTCFMPVVFEHPQEGGILAKPKPTNTSGDFVSLVGTDGFVQLDRGQDRFPRGHACEFFPW